MLRKATQWNLPCLWTLEKLTNEKLLNLHSVADRNKDVQLIDFVEGEFLVEQVDAVKKNSGFSNILTVGCLIPYALYQLFFAVENLTNSKALIHM
ncbi:Ferritin-3, chloroplastic [Linum perenne]